MISQFKTETGKLVAIAFIVSAILVGTMQGQTSSFTYQGKLTDNSLAANGTYQMQFGLYDASSTQLGSTITVPSVQVANGIFTVTLDFGPGAFPGPPRFLQVGVFSTSMNAFVQLTPRQAMTSSPYAVRSLNSSTADVATDSTQLGGVAASQYVQTGDTRLSDARNPLPGSPNYIQSNPPIQQAGTFNINGTGTANIFNAASQYNIAAKRMLSASGTNNIFGGSGSGNANTSGAADAFFGFNAGNANTSGSFNSFFGSNAGAANTTAINNAFFGQGAGFKNTIGHDNTLIGNGAGVNNLDANSNTFVGSLAGQGNVGGDNNTFVGVNAGVANVGSNNNTFIGANSANSNLTGSGNTYVGTNTDGSVLATNATAIGQNAFAGQSNSLILGGIKGVNGALSDTAVGIGTSTPEVALHVKQTDTSSTSNATYPLLVESDTFAVGMQFRNNYLSQGHTWTVTTDGNGNQIGNFSIKDTFFPTTSLTLTSAGSGNSSLFIDGTIALSLATGGHTSVCVNGPTSGILSTCSSSLRYKKDIEGFTPGLRLLNQLHPISFRWRSDNEADLGFGAEDVAKAEPLLVTHNAKGEVEGVKYDRITAVLVNAVKEQQSQIDTQNRLINELQTRLARVERSNRRPRRRTRRSSNVSK
jgi:hypothetical protein